VKLFLKLQNLTDLYKLLQIFVG